MNWAYHDDGPGGWITEHWAGTKCHHLWSPGTPSPPYTPYTRHSGLLSICTPPQQRQAPGIEYVITGTRRFRLISWKDEFNSNRSMSCRGSRMRNLMILIIPRVLSSAETLQLSVDKEITLNRTNNSNPTRCWFWSNARGQDNLGQIGTTTKELCWLWYLLSLLVRWVDM